MKFFAKIIAAAAVSAALFGCGSDDEQTSTAPESNIIGLSFNDPDEISYCLPRYLSDPETRTISEVFTGDELTYGHLILRSQPKKRAGMYFFVMFGYEPDDIALACKFVLEVDSTDHPKARTFTYTVPQTHSVLREIKLGITGSDWPNPSARVNAWRLTLLSPSGKVLAQKQSWLWSVKYGESRLKKNDSKPAEVKTDAAEKPAEPKSADAKPAEKK